MTIRDSPIILCTRTKETERRTEDFAQVLRESAHSIGQHGLSPEEFVRSGLFQGAIERIRGQQAATMTEKRAFIAAILDHLKKRGSISVWRPSGSTDRHDYEIALPDGKVAVLEAKGCLDGANTNIFIRPANADEFVIWSLCQNSNADPRHNAWSGIHTRLSAEMMHHKEQVDGVVIWDMLCGTIGRPCPKLQADPTRATVVGIYTVPPPCIYLFPKRIPDPRNSPAPPVWQLAQVGILDAMHKAFGGDINDITEVHIQAGMMGPTVTRSTKLTRNGQTIFESRPTPIKRAR